LRPANDAVNISPMHSPFIYSSPMKMQHSTTNLAVATSCVQHTQRSLYHGPGTERTAL